MKRIGGNINATFQSFNTVKNRIGEEEQKWSDIATHEGWLDLAGERTSYQHFNAVTVEATHVFICDCFEIDAKSIGRLVINGIPYDVTSFDEPMNLGTQFEIYLKEVNQNVETGY